MDYEHKGIENRQPLSRHSMKHRLSKLIVTVLRLVIGCIFIVSSISKIRQPYDFLAGVYSYELVGPGIGVAVASILPWLELFVGICLVGGILVTGALAASIGMFAMFSFVLVSALWRELQISCSCFNPSAEGIMGYWTVIRTLVLLAAAAAAVAYICSIKSKSPEHQSERL